MLPGQVPTGVAVEGDENLPQAPAVVKFYIIRESRGNRREERCVQIGFARPPLEAEKGDLSDCRADG